MISVINLIDKNSTIAVNNNKIMVAVICYANVMF